MNPALTVAVAQFAPAVDIAVNLHAIERLVVGATAAGARLIVLPEESMLLASDVGGSLADIVEREWPIFLAHLSRLAVDGGVWVIAGGYEPSGTARPYNTLVVLNPQGQVVVGYRKVHLYDAFSYRESDYVTPGSDLPPVVLIEGVAVGLVNCYDIRFPELSRDLVSRGADVLSVSAAWVSGPRKEDHWSTLLRARAIENTCWVLASGSTSAECIGLSAVIDPIGIERAQLGPTGEAFVVVDVRLDRIAEVRETLPALANRRLVSTVHVATVNAQE